MSPTITSGLWTPSSRESAPPYTACDERERPQVREAPRRRGRDVDDDANAGLDELLGGDAVDVGVVDDRDVVRAEALDEVLRPPVELRVAGVLDEAHGYSGLR